MSTATERARIDVAALGLNPATVGEMDRRRPRHFEPIELERALELLLDLDRQIKTGETTPEVALELAIVQTVHSTRLRRLICSTALGALVALLALLPISSAAAFSLHLQPVLHRAAPTT